MNAQKNKITLRSLPDPVWSLPDPVWSLPDPRHCSFTRRVTVLYSFKTVVEVNCNCIINTSACTTRRGTAGSLQAPHTHADGTSFLCGDRVQALPPLPPDSPLNVSGIQYYVMQLTIIGSANLYLYKRLMCVCWFVCLLPVLPYTFNVCTSLYLTLLKSVPKLTSHRFCAQYKGTFALSLRGLLLPQSP